MKVEICIGDVRAALPPEAVESIVNLLGETPEAPALLDLLSRHPAHIVRQAAADAPGLSESAWRALLDDAVPQVVAVALGNMSHGETLTAEDALKILEKHPSITSQAVESFFAAFENPKSKSKDKNALSAFWESHPDPGVIHRCLDSLGIPPKLLKALVKHPDGTVAAKARQVLEEYA